MSHARSLHSASLLDNGNVLVTGGWNGIYEFDSTEIFDVQSQTWNFINPMNGGRHYHSASVLRDGQILIIGGEHGVTTLNTAE